MAPKKWSGMVVLTGSPGTGKKTVLPYLERSLKSRTLNLNQLAASDAAVTRSGGLVDTRRLRSKLLKLDLSNTIVFGHLAPHVLQKEEPSFVAVLRCEPSELKKRLQARGYPAGKVTENVESELIGVVLDECLRAFGDSAVHEYDTTHHDPEPVASLIARDLADGSPHAGPWIDWTLDYDSSTKLRSLLSSPTTEPAST